MIRRNNLDLSQRRDDKIYILGGSFNPVHNGHIAMAESVHKMFSCEVVFVPNKSTYYKDNSLLATDEDRLCMLELLSDSYDYIRYSDIEIKRGGVTHTIDTVRELRNIYGYKDIYFIIGGDSLEWIDRWVDADELLESVKVLSAIRGETDRKKSMDIIERLKNEHPKSRVILLDMKDNPVSSSDIRKKISLGMPVGGLVPESVEEYIINNNLYKG